MIPSPTHDDNTFLQKKIMESFGLSFQQDDKTEQKNIHPKPSFYQWARWCTMSNDSFNSAAVGDILTNVKRSCCFRKKSCCLGLFFEWKIRYRLFLWLEKQRERIWCVGDLQFWYCFFSNVKTGKTLSCSVKTYYSFCDKRTDFFCEGI